MLMVNAASKTYLEMLFPTEHEIELGDKRLTLVLMTMRPPRDPQLLNGSDRKFFQRTYETSKKPSNEVLSTISSNQEEL